MKRIILLALLCFAGSLPPAKQEPFFKDGTTPAPVVGPTSDANWKFNGDLLDASGGAHTLMISPGSASYTTDEAGASTKAIHFTGTQSCVDTSGTSLGNYTTSDFSVAFWAKDNTTDFNDHPVVVSKGIFDASGWYVQLVAQAGFPASLGHITFTLNEPSSGGQAHVTLTADAGISVGVWYYIVCEKVGTSCKIFINGVDSTVTVDYADPASDAHSLVVGDYPTGGNHFTGNIAQVQVIGRALSSVEVATLYVAGSQ